MSDATAAQAAPSTVEVTINGVVVDARPGELVIAAADRAGVHIPRFCYHERMSPVGMCRMCLVEIDTGRGPQLQASCTVSVSPQMVVDTTSERTQRAQEGVLELLLINHPLDCPVCDKGGECPLQDQTMAYGPGESRFVEEKRHFEKPIPISDLVHLDRERCILCDRCTRFADEVAGDPLIDFTERGNETQVLTFPGEPLLVVLLRQHGADLSRRRADRSAVPLQGAAVGSGPKPSPPARRAQSAAGLRSSRREMNWCAIWGLTSTR